VLFITALERDIATDPYVCLGVRDTREPDNAATWYSIDELLSLIFVCGEAQYSL